MNDYAEVLSISQSPLAVKLADSPEELEKAFRLRYRVFVEEARNLPLYNAESIEIDEFDRHCDHLIVKDQSQDRIVGTYRLLPGERTIGMGFYSETEFDLSGFQDNRFQTLELGRSCIDPEYRGSSALKMLWEGIAGYLNNNPHKYLIGCVSLHVKNLPELNRIYSLLAQKGVISSRFNVRPHETHRISGLRINETEAAERNIFRLLPPLMKGYHWLGAEFQGEPAYDGIFDTTDFFIVLETSRVAKRYSKHFLGR